MRRAGCSPVLDRVEAIAQMPRKEEPALDPIELRRSGLMSLRELLGRIADRRTLIVHIDDGQWGDPDSAKALLEILRPPDAPGMLLLLTYRPESRTGSFVSIFDEPASDFDHLEIEDVSLTELDEQAAADSASRLMPEAAESDPTMVARESGGNPFLIAELARDLLSGERDASASLSTLVARRARRLSPEARRVLEIVAIGGEPVPAETVRVAAGLTRLDSALLHELSALHLVRTTEVPGSIASALECYHDRIREGVLEHMSAETALTRHRELAEAFGATGGAPEALAVHLRAAEAWRRPHALRSRPPMRPARPWRLTGPRDCTDLPSP